MRNGCEGIWSERVTRGELQMGHQCKGETCVCSDISKVHLQRTASAFLPFVASHMLFQEKGNR